MRIDTHAPPSPNLRREVRDDDDDHDHWRLRWEDDGGRIVRPPSPSRRFEEGRDEDDHERQARPLRRSGSTTGLRP